jgi:hypothetical protein
MVEMRDNIQDSGDGWFDEYDMEDPDMV